MRDVLGISQERVDAFEDATPLFGALPELDSMAVAGVLTELEDRLGIVIEDDEVDGEMLETFGALLRARAGDRDAYAPIVTPLASTAKPADVARGLLEVGLEPLVAGGQRGGRVERLGTHFPDVIDTHQGPGQFLLRRIQGSLGHAVGR